MKKLTFILKEKWAHLGALAKILAHEQQLLCSGSVQNIPLQKITEKKGTVLEKLSMLDKDRLDEGSALGLEAPYSDIPLLNQEWIKIQKIIPSLHSINIHNGRLLEHYLNHNARTLAILNARHQVSLYGPDGLARQFNPNRRTPA